VEGSFSKALPCNKLIVNGLVVFADSLVVFADSLVALNSLSLEGITIN